MLPSVFSPAFLGTDALTGRPQYDLPRVLEVVQELLVKNGYTSVILADAVEIFERELEPLSSTPNGPLFLDTSASVDEGDE